ncbi:MAG: SDR family oxidoreductase [Oscillatoriales cyanobacterium RM2_1_1]|nr:SDR family oxidoreductase [Oscillatoriales cyanobacterium SM2_3_0]NJO47771.1 SDR family oxidoreductase [Oscillatoriales cyanobacterium RM2_1_1]
MVRPAALEYASHGIRINNINPGIIDTEMLRRFFQPEEIAETVLWLCSDAASYITGQTISVDAGYAIPGHR